MIDECAFSFFVQKMKMGVLIYFFLKNLKLSTKSRFLLLVYNRLRLVVKCCYWCITAVIFQDAVTTMDEYVSLPAKRLGHLVRKYVHHSRMKDIEGENFLNVGCINHLNLRKLWLVSFLNAERIKLLNLQEKARISQ